MGVVLCSPNLPLALIRENGCDNKGGLKPYTRSFFKKILKGEHSRVKDCNDGICHIRRRLNRNKVLVVLNDVDNIKQL